MYNLFRGELYTGNYSYGLKPFTDLTREHWAYNQIMEAACDHYFKRTADGNEQIVY